MKFNIITNLLRFDKKYHEIFVKKFNQSFRSHCLALSIKECQMHKIYESNSILTCILWSLYSCHSFPFFAASNLMLSESVWKSYWVIKFYDDRQMHFIFLLETKLHAEISFRCEVVNHQSRWMRKVKKLLHH